VKVPAVAMLNIIGASSDMSQITAFVKLALAVPGVSVHLYGKTECRKGRKMGHVTIVGDSDAQVRERLRPLLQALPSGTTTEELELYSERAITVCSERSHHHPLVGIIMGSDSDLPVMRGAALALDHFKIPYELTIVSAHRTPKRLVEYAHSADARGLKVIITGAGGAAHLPGMVASMTSLPVIGVPIKTNALNGVDSLYSIVQMPVRSLLTRTEKILMPVSQRGIPVATTAINGAENAGLLAARILSVAMPELLSAMNDYRSALEMEVIAKVDKLDEVGWVKYEVKK
jgi:phosphoribosylaminoimidazole carboxylase